jgi:hypothetical protein
MWKTATRSKIVGVEVVGLGIYNILVLLFQLSGLTFLFPAPLLVNAANLNGLGKAICKIRQLVRVKDEQAPANPANANKGKLSKRKVGMKSLYETPGQHKDNELFFVAQGLNSLSQVWAYILSKDLTDEERNRARKARDELENILAKKTA